MCSVHCRIKRGEIHLEQISSFRSAISLLGRHLKPFSLNGNLSKLAPKAPPIFLISHSCLGCVAEEVRYHDFPSSENLVQGVPSGSQVIWVRNSPAVSFPNTGKESENMPSWNGPIRIIESSSWIHTGPSKNQKCAKTHKGPIMMASMNLFSYEHWKALPLLFVQHMLCCTLNGGFQFYTDIICNARSWRAVSVMLTSWLCEQEKFLYVAAAYIWIGLNHVDTMIINKHEMSLYTNQINSNLTVPTVKYNCFVMKRAEKGP